MFRKMPFVLAAIILAVIFLDLPIGLQQCLYSISLSIKSIVVMALPVIIFCLLFKAVVVLSSGASRIIALTLGLVCCSNFLSTFLSHSIGSWIYNFDFSIIKPEDSGGLLALWSFSLPKLIPNDVAMFSGIITGFLMSKFFTKNSRAVAEKIELYVQKLLNGFIYFIPLFVAGFVVKLQSDGIVSLIIKDYSLIFLIIACVIFTYVTVAYFILNNCVLKKTLAHIMDMMPAAISGFTTMSSAASMPLTIIAAENNAQNKDVARSVIPATVNIHLVGDCFSIPIFAYAVLKSFGMAEPSLSSYLIFAFYFVLAKFSVAAVPGGGILVMLPILESHLGFNSEMMSLITALYVLFDPVITCGNILGNGAFAKMVDRITSRKINFLV